ncbi:MULTISPECIES: hypothetical protein [Geobacillus]|uniref:Uncharacterized protein n=1 Tax=Geobacillus thermodenitrificans (strain NG80-2) TaxID=420246 RepID=A4IPS7_GEOTN|nr:hypothetical protein [Geobacillus sp. PA-3]ABO67331.1 hypothetical protein GTNG_1976 [Geobacillus thermodenitrificans NG80-2]
MGHLLFVQYHHYGVHLPREAIVFPFSLHQRHWSMQAINRFSISAANFSSVGSLTMPTSIVGFVIPIVVSPFS